MGVRNRNREVLQRLDSKTLVARFTTEIQQGLNCSLFEAEFRIAPEDSDGNGTPARWFRDANGDGKNDLILT
jgi:hypothetical protein